MAIKKTELYSSLWQSCDELRGGMDASQYKDYILTLLFMKYVSDKYAGNPNAIILVPSGGSFADMVRLKGYSEIGDKFNKIISRLAEENDLKGVIDVADFNDEDKLGKGKEMVDRLSRLVAIFEGLELGANRAGGDDLLGDAYEYLMRNFATESGKSKGQFYTPAEVSRIMAKVVGINASVRQDQTVYDPTCGSGSLLLKASDEAPKGMTIYGQEMDNATAALARMNMILHNNPTAEIWRDNTLSAPHWCAGNALKSFDFAVANPPFSYKSWTNGVNPGADEFSRFEYGIPPAKNGDYAFLLHLLKSLKSTGKGAIIMPHGVLFRGNAEADIRRTLVRQGVIKGIIGLPANLFYGTGIPACIIVIDKENAHSRSGIFMIDGGKEFIKDGNKNRLRSRDIHKIVDTFNRQNAIPGYARMVSFAEIEKNDYNLNIPRYIDSSDTEDLHDLSAHLNGGIPQRDIDALDAYWKVFPSLRRSLFAASPRLGYSNALIETSQAKKTILNHAEFVAFAQHTLAIYQAWQAAHTERLNNLTSADDPKHIIEDLAEDLLARFTEIDLIDKYAVYQLLMDYWAESMQDDVYIIVQDGWGAGNFLRELVAENGEKLKETPDLLIGRKKYKADLIPPALLVKRYFLKEQAALDHFQAEKEAITLELETFIEEHSGEEGLLEEALNDKGKLTKTLASSRLKSIKNQVDFTEEQAALEKCLALIEREAQADSLVKTAQKALDEQVFARYPQLSTSEIKTLVVTDKWQTTLQAVVQAEIERVTQQLANRVKLLEERYAEPLPQIVDEVAELSLRVEAHLKRMGVTW